MHVTVAVGETTLTLPTGELSSGLLPPWGVGCLIGHLPPWYGPGVQPEHYFWNLRQRELSPHLC